MELDELGSRDRKNYPHRACQNVSERWGLARHRNETVLRPCRLRSRRGSTERGKTESERQFFLSGIVVKRAFFYYTISFLINFSLQMLKHVFLPTRRETRPRIEIVHVSLFMNVSFLKIFSYLVENNTSTTITADRLVLFASFSYNRSCINN